MSHAFVRHSDVGSDTVSSRFQLVIIAATGALAQDPSHVKARYRRGMARKGMNQFKAAISGKTNKYEYDSHISKYVSVVRF